MKIISGELELLPRISQRVTLAVIPGAGSQQVQQVLKGFKFFAQAVDFHF